MSVNLFARAGEIGVNHRPDPVAAAPGEMDMVAAHHAVTPPSKRRAAAAHCRRPVPESEAELARDPPLPLADLGKQLRDVPAVAAVGSGQPLCAGGGIGRAE